MRKLLLTSLILFGCAYAPYGVQQITTGSATIERGVDKSCTHYTMAYAYIENHCENDVACMEYWGLTEFKYKNVEFLCRQIRYSNDEIERETKHIEIYEYELSTELQKLFHIEENIKRLE